MADSENYVTSGYQGLVLTRAERQLASAARTIARRREVLFHGTQFWQDILSSGTLRGMSIPHGSLCLTRSPEVAAFSAFLPRQRREVEPAILVLDRATLRNRYRLELRHDGWTGHYEVERDEAEEIIYGRDVHDLLRHLHGLVLARGGETLFLDLETQVDQP
jgi:hypothetical protein